MEAGLQLRLRGNLLFDGTFPLLILSLHQSLHHTKRQNDRPSAGMAGVMASPVQVTTSAVTHLKAARLCTALACNECFHVCILTRRLRFATERHLQDC